MDKEQIRQKLNTLIMVSGDCPYERDIGKEADYKCEDYLDCLDCWKKALSKELRK